MARTTTLLALTLVSLLTTLAGPGPAAAQPPAGPCRWAYATLTFEEPLAWAPAVATWQAGKQVLGRRSDKYNTDALAKVYKDLGGKEEQATVGVLLDHSGQVG